MKKVNMEGRYMRTHRKELHTKEDTSGEDTLRGGVQTEGTYKPRGRPHGGTVQSLQHT